MSSADTSQLFHVVQLWPGGSFSRRDRRFFSSEAERRLVQIMVQDDPEPPAPSPGPAAFDPSDIRWAIGSARTVVLWTAGATITDEIAAALADCGKRGGIVLLILTRPEHEDAWGPLIVEHAGSHFQRLHLILPRPENEPRAASN